MVMVDGAMVDFGTDWEWMVDHHKMTTNTVS